MIRHQSGAGEVNSAPLDVEDPVRGTARYRCEDAAVPAGVTRAASLGIGALIVPVGEDGVIVASPRQTLIGERRLGGCELSIPVGRHCDAVEGLVVERVGEWQ